jgi:hypothetical protein
MIFVFTQVRLGLVLGFKYFNLGTARAARRSGVVFLLSMAPPCCACDRPPVLRERCFSCLKDDVYNLVRRAEQRSDQSEETSPQPSSVPP